MRLKPGLKVCSAVAALLLAGFAHGETCTLETYASSWMTTGTPFAVNCPSGKYTGHLVTTPAKRFFRRGHLMLVFDQPFTVQAKKDGDEGKIQAGRGRQIANILTAGGVGIGAKDLTDGIASAAFRSWMVLPVSCAAIAFFSNGGDVLLKPGYRIAIVSRRD